MKLFSLPSKILTLIFDIDSTLYTNEDYATEQVDIQIRQFAFETKITPEQARKEISDFQKEYADKHNGTKLSLGNTLVYFGIPIKKSIEWRQKLLKPEDFLCKDEKLIETLKQLSQKYKLITVTNNPVLPASKTLKAIGIDSFFADIIGLDTCGVSKPHEKPFLLAAKMTNTLPQNCVSIGDRFSIDIELPLKLGMGGILVTSVNDVYDLIKIL